MSSSNCSLEQTVSAEDYQRLKKLNEEFIYILNKYRYPAELNTSPLTLLRGKAYDVKYTLNSVERE